MISRRFTLAVLASVMAAMFGSDRTLAEPTKVRYAAFPCTHCAQGWLMPEFGKNHNLEVELITMKRYSDIQVALATGQVDAGNFGFINIPLMAENDLHEVKVVAGVSDGAQGLIVRSGSDVESWSDVEGLRIGAAPNSMIENLFKSAMEHFGADPGKVEWISFTTMGPEVLQSLERGDIDGFLGWEPAMAKAVLEGYGVYADLPLEDGPAGIINGALGMSAEFMANNPEAALAVVRTHVEITDYLNANHDEWRNLAMRVTGSDAETTQLGIEHSILHYQLPQANIKELAKLLHEAGLTKEDHSDAVSSYLDYSLLEQVTGQSASELGQE